MRYFKLDKLVRDKIVGQMKKNNQLPLGVRVLSLNEYIEHLKKKIVEEATELAVTTNPVQVKEEIADLLAVISSLTETLEITEEELAVIRARQAEDKGLFRDKTYVETIGISEDDPWLEYYVCQPRRFPEVPNPDKKNSN